MSTFAERYRVTRARLCRLAAVCVLVNLAIQSFQELAYAYFIPAATTPALALAARNLPIDRARAVAVFASMVPLLIIYVATAVERARRAPGAALFGLIGWVLFIAFELGHRAIDLFFVSLRWAPAWAAATSEAARQLVAERVATWEAVGEAIYVPLVLTATIGAASYAVSLRGERGWPARLGRWAWTINAARLGLRVLGFSAIKALQPVNDAIYFPAVLVTHALLAYWLWRTAAAPDAAPSRTPAGAPAA